MSRIHSFWKKNKLRIERSSLFIDLDTILEICHRAFNLLLIPLLRWSDTCSRCQTFDSDTRALVFTSSVTSQTSQKISNTQVLILCEYWYFHCHSWKCKLLQRAKLYGMTKLARYRGMCHVIVAMSHFI